MVSFSSLLVLAAATVAGVSALPTNGTELEARSGTASSTGINNGYYYSFWSDGQGNVIYTNKVSRQSGIFVSGEQRDRSLSWWCGGDYDMTLSRVTIRPNALNLHTFFSHVI